MFVMTISSEFMPLNLLNLKIQLFDVAGKMKKVLAISQVPTLIFIMIFITYIEHYSASTTLLYYRIFF